MATGIEFHCVSNLKVSFCNSESRATLSTKFSFRGCFIISKRLEKELGISLIIIQKSEESTSVVRQ